MSDSVKKILTEHIRQTLEDYEAPYALGAWEQFDQQRRQTKRQWLAGWVRYAAAACLLLGMFLLPLWLSDGQLPIGSSGLVSSRTTGRSTKPTPIPIQTDLASSLKDSPEANRRLPAIARSSLRSTKSRSGGLPSTDPLATKQPLPASPILSPSSITAVSPIQPPTTDRLATLTREPVPAVELLSPLPVQQPRPTDQTPTKPEQSTGVATVQQAMAELEPKEQTARRRSVMWSLALNPQAVYAQNSSSAITLGGGFLSEIALTRRMSVSTGLSLAQQTLAVTPSINQPVPMVVGSRQLQSTNVRLVALDLPITINYQVGKLTKPLFHISAGLSSLAFLGEDYTYTYQALQTRAGTAIDLDGRPRTVMETVTVRTTENVSTAAFQRVYWGRLVNLAIGVDRPLSPRLLLSVEPYVKYPIGSLTQESLRLGSAGVSLRVKLR